MTKSKCAQIPAVHLEQLLPFLNQYLISRICSINILNIAKGLFCKLSLLFFNRYMFSASSKVKEMQKDAPNLAQLPKPPRSGEGKRNIKDNSHNNGNYCK